MLEDKNKDNKSFQWKEIYRYFILWQAASINHFLVLEACFSMNNANQELNVVKFHRSYHFVQELYFTRYLFVHFVYAT